MESVKPSKLEFNDRLGDDWWKLADALNIPDSDQRRFKRGEEGRDIWEWLGQRKRLSELENALKVINRPDLITVLPDELRQSPHEEKEAPTNMPSSPEELEFIGRKKEIEDLGNYIKSGGLVVVWGLFGIGKTWLALKVANQMYKNSELPGGAAWIDCQKFKSFEERLHYIAYIFLHDRLDSYGLKQCEERIWQYLQEKKGLVVLDNLDLDMNNLESDQLKWLQYDPTPSCILVTTRTRQRRLERAVKKWLPIPQLEEIEAHQLFIQKYNSSRREQHIQDLHNNDVAEICRNMAYNPMLVESIAIRAEAIPLRRLVRLSERFKNDDPEEVWRTSLDSIYRSLSKESSLLLNNLSVLPGDIGEEVIEKVSEIENWDEAAQELVGKAMWDLGSNDRYVINALVKTYAQKQLGDQLDKTKQRVFNIVMQLAKKKSGFFQPDDICLIEEEAMENDKFNKMRESLDWFEAEWLNLMGCKDYALESNDNRLLFDLADTMLHFMIPRGHYKECKILYEQTLHRRMPEDDAIGRARTLNDLGVCQQFLGKHDNAIESFKQSIELLKKLLGDNIVKNGNVNIQFLKTLNSLGFNYYELNNNKLDEAEEEFLRAQRFCEELIIKQKGGDCDTKTFSWKTLECCEKILRNARRLTQSKDETQAICKVCVELSQTYSNLGLLYTSKYKKLKSEGQQEKADEEFQKAETAFSRSIKIKEHGDSRYGQVLNRQANLYMLKEGGWSARIERLFEKSRDSLNEITNRFELGVAYKGLGDIYLEREDFETAKTNYRKSLNYFENNPNEKFEVHDKLGDIYEKDNNWEMFEQETEQMNRIAKFTGREDHEKKVREKMKMILDRN